MTYSEKNSEDNSREQENVESDVQPKCPDSVEQNSVTDDNATAKRVGIAAVAAAVLTHSPPANAWVNDLAKAISENITKVITEPLQSLFGRLGEVFSASGMFGTQEESKAIARSTDIKNEITKGIEQSKIMRATEPPPQPCYSVAESQHIGNMQKITESTVARLQAGQAQSALESAQKGSESEQSKLIERMKLNAVGNQPSDFLLQCSAYVREGLDTYNDEQVQEAAKISIDVMYANLSDAIGVPQITGNMSREQVARAQAQASKRARLNVATSILQRDVAERIPEQPGQASYYETLKKTVNRTYGGDGEWHSEVMSKADPVPLLKDLVLQTSVTNKLLLEQRELLRRGNSVMATQLLEQIESNLRERPAR